MQHIARFFSNLFTPLLMPSYGILLALWVSILSYLPFGSRIAVLLVIFGITCILPVIFIAVLQSFKVIEDSRLVGRKDRILPYLFMIVCYVGAAFYLSHVHAPMWVIAFMIGGLATVILSFVVNFWWKISGHLGGIGGVVALLFRLHIDGLGAFDLQPLICCSIVLAGMLATSRMILDRHSFWQLVAGFVNGFCCVYFTSKLIG